MDYAARRAHAKNRPAEAERNVVLALLVTLVVAFLYPPLWANDDANILGQARAGIVSLLATYGGYLAVVQRAVALVQGPSPMLIGALGSYLAVFLVAVFLAWRVHPWTVLALVLVPATNVYGTLSDIQWVLAVYLVGMLVATPATSRRGRLGDAVGVFVCGLTGPFSILLLPLYAVRAVNPAWRLTFVAIATAALVQLVVMASSGRPSSPEHDVLAVVVARAWVPVGLILLSGLWNPWPRVAGALYVALVVPTLGVMATYHSTTELLTMPTGERYFYLSWIIAIGMLMLRYSDRRRTASGTARPESRSSSSSSRWSRDTSMQSPPRPR